VAYSGLHLDPGLASRDEGAPRERRMRGAVGGGVVLIATTSRQKPPSGHKNISFKRSYLRPIWLGLKQENLRAARAARPGGASRAALTCEFALRNKKSLK
jgi:hypothetical protein